MKEKIFNTKIVAVISALVLLIVSISFYNPVETNALSQVTYLRYDYTNPTAQPYKYTISVPDTVFSDGMQSRYISPPNNMSRDYNTAVVRLSVGGTGFIISDHVIVTAAHCLYNCKEDQFINVTIDIVGDDNRTIKNISPHYAHVTKKFADLSNEYDEQYDYGLIYVDEDLSDYGEFGMGICLDSYIENSGKVIVSGFPVEYPDGYVGGYGLRFKSEGNITGSNNNGINIKYDADMTNGDSGGPVYVNESYIDIEKEIFYDYNTVIAINVAQNKNKKINYGVRVNFDILYFCYRNANLTA